MLHLDTKDGSAYDYPVTVTVDAKKPTAKAAQTVKANLFYTDAEAVFKLTTSAAVEKIEDVTGTADGEPAMRLETFDAEAKTFTLQAEGLDKETLVAFKDAASEAVNRRIKVSFAGYSDEVSVVLNVKAGCTVTAPKITLQETQHTNWMPLGATAFVDSKTKAELTAEEMDGTYLKKFTNLYAAELTTEARTGSLLLLMAAPEQKKPASVAYTVTLANPKWTGDLVLSSKLTLVKEFTLKPECSTIQLNTRLADRLDGVDAESSIRVNKSYMEVQDLVFSGKNAAAEQALNQGLSLTFDKDTQTVKATLARDYTMKPGTYTYLMTGHVGRSLASTPAKAQKLTIKILDGAKAQTGISLKAKGSIDLLDREQSKIVYTPSFKNMTAKLTDATFASRDPNKDLFDLSVENGKIVLQAKSGVELSTRQTYQVRMLLILNNRYTGSVTVKVKPTAKYPKIKVTPAKTTLYKGTESRLQAAVTLTGKTNAAIKDVTLD